MRVHRVRPALIHPHEHPHLPAGARPRRGDREIVVAVRRNISIDWAVKENVRAQMRATVKRILRKNGYPPDRQESTTETVLEQAKVVCRDLATENEGDDPVLPGYAGRPGIKISNEDL
jgi:hypothetical protein